ncbi:MAG: glycosyltransferase family 9 protein [Vicinamibacterales bacterium]
MKILLVRLRQIGDVVFTTPTLAALANRFPGVELTYLVEPAAAPVVSGNPHGSRVLVVPRRPGLGGLLDDIRLGGELRRMQFDIVLDFHGGPRASLLTWLSRAPRRVGYEIKGRAWMYTDRVARARELRARHSVENQWDLLTAIGVEPPSRERYPAEMVVDAGVAASVRQRLVTHGVSADDAVVIMHVSAGNPFRRWPLESFADVAATLAQASPRVRVIITSGPSEAGAAQQVIDNARARLPEHRRGAVLECGEFSLVELRALTDLAALYIGGDSGPMHIASTSRVPMVSLYGPTLPARSEPWRASADAAAVEVHGLTCRPCEQRVCVPGDFRCLTGITPAQVIDAATRLLHVTG